MITKYLIYPYTVLFIASFAIGAAYAEPEVKLSGQIRVREELRAGLFSPADPTGEVNTDLTRLRSRLRTDVTINPNVGVVIEFQDVRLLGSEGSTVADTEGVDLKRGYLSITPEQSNTTVKIGRWVMAYGDQRLIGHLEWFDQGRSYDGVHVSFKPEKIFVDAFAVRMRETLDAKDDLHFGGVYGGVHLDNTTDLELYALGLRDSMAPNSTFGTFGLRFATTRGPMDASVEAALQVGTKNDQDLLAFAAAAKAGYTVPESSSLRFGGEIAFASGDDDPADADNGTFQTLFPTNHLHYGYADLAAWQNILALRAQLSVVPIPRTTVSLNYHHLRLADPAGGWFNAGGG